MRELEEIGWILGDAMLLASELVTDSVLHSGCPQDDPIEVDVTLEEDHLTIAVTDCAGAERHPLRDESAPSRMALALVRMLARRWGVEHRGRRRVWVELARPAAAPARSS